MKSFYNSSEQKKINNLNDSLFNSSSPSSSSLSFDSHSLISNTNNQSTTSGGENFTLTINPQSDYENNLINANFENTKKYIQ